MPRRRNYRMLSPDKNMYTMPPPPKAKGSLLRREWKESKSQKWWMVARKLSARHSRVVEHMNSVLVTTCIRSVQTWARPNPSMGKGVEPRRPPMAAELRAVVSCWVSGRLFPLKLWPPVNHTSVKDLTTRNIWAHNLGLNDLKKEKRSIFGKKGVLLGRLGERYE